MRKEDFFINENLFRWFKEKTNYCISLLFYISLIERFKTNFIEFFPIFFRFISEHKFSIYSASTTAAASIAASLYGMHWHSKSGISISSLLDMLKDLTGVEKVNLLKNINIIVILKWSDWLVVNRPSLTQLIWYLQVINTGELYSIMGVSFEIHWK